MAARTTDTPIPMAAAVRTAYTISAIHGVPIKNGRQTYKSNKPGGRKSLSNSSIAHKMSAKKMPVNRFGAERTATGDAS
jgi:hypothetical protein